MSEPDEFTIARPRWVLPVMVIGVLLLFIGLVVGRIAKTDDNTPTPARTGGSAPTVVVTTTR